MYRAMHEGKIDCDQRAFSLHSIFYASRMLLKLSILQRSLSEIAYLTILFSKVQTYHFEIKIKHLNPNATCLLKLEMILRTFYTLTVTWTTFAWPHKKCYIFPRSLVMCRRNSKIENQQRKELGGKRNFLHCWWLLHGHNRAHITFTHFTYRRLTV